MSGSRRRRAGLVELAALTLVGGTLFSGTLDAQSRWRLEGARMRATIGAGQVLGPHDVLERDAAGEEVGVHFPFDGLGKPASLRFVVPDGADVRVGVAAAGAPPSLPEGSFGADARATVLATRDGDVSAELLSGDEHSPRDYRVSVKVTSFAPETGRFGVVARHGDGQGRYLFSIDRDAKLARLERWHGDSHFVVQRAELAEVPADGCTLALEVTGFRLQAFVDERAVLRTLDGGLPGGAPGLAWTGARPGFGELELAPPAATLGSAALVQLDGEAVLHAAVAEATPGSLYAIELALDRPHAWVPLSPSGFEPWVCQRPAAPVVMWGDIAGSIGDATVGEVSPEGGISARLRWPQLPQLRGLSVLVRAQVATADGVMLTEQTPSVGLRF